MQLHTRRGFSLARLLASAFLLAGCGTPSTGINSDLGHIDLLGGVHDFQTVGDGGTSCDPLERSCSHTFTWTYSGTTQPDIAEVRGSFNNYSPGALPMKLVNGAWTATTELPYGSAVEYKFWAQWNNNPSNPIWVNDPASPTAPDGNSLLASVTCTSFTCAPATPQLILVAPPSVGPTAYSFDVRFVPADGASTSEIDTTKTTILLNGSGVTSVPYSAASHTFSVSVTSGITSPNKYAYRFSVTDLSGRTASLFVPFWVEATPFQWNDAFMYEVMIDRFFAGGTSLQGPNGPPTESIGDWKGGDFGGVTKKITSGYFDAMGVNALWISSPILVSKLCELGTGVNTGHCLSAYHSYFPIASGWVDGSDKDPQFISAGITNPIDPHFGTLADLQTLVQTAHQHGIRVLTDLVINHVFSDAAPPDGQAPQLAPMWSAHQTDSNWFNLPYNVSVNDCGAENLWDTDTSQLWNRANCWFDPYLPDLNSMSPTVGVAIANHAAWLMETFNLDGFRVDATKQVESYICIALRSKLTSEISTGLPFYMVGEALGNIVGNVMDCVGANRLDGSMNDPLHYTMVSTFLQGSENGNSLDSDVQYDESTWTGQYSGALMGHFFGSHDVARAISQAANDVGDPWNSPPPAQETNPVAFSRLGLAQAFLLTYDSLPILWMGDEFGMPGSVDPDNRRLMRFDGALNTNEQATLTNLQKLGKARAAHIALRRGTRTRLWVDGTFYAYGRVDGSDIVVAAFNLDPSNSATRSIPVDNIGLTGTVTDVLSGTSATVSGNNLSITLAPLTAAVYTH